jgi:diguanylate cyclase (GGDEF)-like protein
VRLVDVRQYSYDVDDVQHLFAEIIESLSSSKIAQDTVSHILAQVCAFFKFGRGFVYEADHAGVFTLKERFGAQAASPLPEAFEVEQQLSAGEIGDILSLYAVSREKPAVSETGTLMLAHIYNDSGKIIGLVGMMDRRRNILMDKESTHAVKMVLNLLAKTVKMRMFQQRLEYTRQALVSILDNTGIDIYVSDFLSHEILYVNKSMAKPYGGLERMLGKKCWQALYSDKNGPCGYCPQQKLIDENGKPTRVYSWDYQRPFDGSWFRVLSAAFHWVDGRLAHIVSSVDITENKKNENTIARMANYDPLTKLPNRRKLQSDYEEALCSAGQNGGSGYLLFFDLDNFKSLNDSMGHQAGDELLAQIGTALMRHSLTAGHIYRHGGDEFILFYRNAGRGHVRLVVDFLLTRFEQPWPLQKAAPVCRVSIGVAASPDDGLTLDELLNSADLMMYKAKRNGRGIACFTDGEIVKASISSHAPVSSP